MAYSQQLWNDYDERKTETQNIENGAVVTSERMNYIENGVSANNKRTEELKREIENTQVGFLGEFNSEQELENKFSKGTKGFAKVNITTNSVTKSYSYSYKNNAWTRGAEWATPTLPDNTIVKSKLERNLKRRLLSFNSIERISFSENSYINYVNGKKVALQSVYMSSDFIELPKYQLIMFDYDLEVIANSRGLAFYLEKSESSFISGVQYDGTAQALELNPPLNAKYIRVTTRQEKVNEIDISVKDLIKSLNQIEDEFNRNNPLSSLNLIDSEKVIWSKYIRADGAEANYPDGSLGITEFIRIPEKSMLKLANVANKKVTDIRSCCIYDEEKRPLKVFKYSELALDLHPEILDAKVTGAYYFRATVMKEITNPLLLIENTAELLLSFEVKKDIDPIVNPRFDGGYANILNTINFCGDSLTKGQQEAIDSEGKISYIDMQDYSFGTRVGKILGNDVKIFAKGGLTAKAFYKAYHLELLKDENKAMAYNIYLGTNDRNNSPYVVGNKEDIDLIDKNNNSNSFYGWYAKIIQTIQEAQPRAKIFLMALPKNAQATKSIPYNEAIKELTEIFDNCFLIDTFNQWDEQTTSWMAKYGSGTHLNSMGYQKYAFDWVVNVNNIIEKNMKEFRDVGFIGRTETPHYIYN